MEVGEYMKLEILKCPSCGANVEFEEGIEFCECEYCGAKITVAPSQESKNNVAEPAKSFSLPTFTLKKANSRDNASPDEGTIRKGIVTVFNVLFVISLFFAGVSLIITISDKNISMLFFGLFCLIWGVMFKVLARTPKGSAYILGKKKGIKPVYFVLICVLLAFAAILISPATEETTDDDSESAVVTEINTMSD